MKYVFANWKAHKNLSEARLWVSEFLDNLPPETNNNLQIIILPPAPLILPIRQLVAEYSFIAVGAQDVSALGEGPHTGEVAAYTLKDIARYCLVGHSERRAMGEGSQAIAAKIANLHIIGIEPVLCVSEGSQIAANVRFIAFEQAAHIGSGTPTPIAEVVEFKQEYVQPDQLLIYGGSIEESNIDDYLQFDGLLLGRTSLNPKLFAEVATKMCT